MAVEFLAGFKGVQLEQGACGGAGSPGGPQPLQHSLGLLLNQPRFSLIWLLLYFASENVLKNTRKIGENERCSL